MFGVVPNPLTILMKEVSPYFDNEKALYSSEIDGFSISLILHITTVAARYRCLRTASQFAKSSVPKEALKPKQLVICV